MINNKPIGAICIASVKIAKVLQSVGRNGKAMGGFDGKILADIKSMGIVAEKIYAEGIVVDNENKIISTHAYVEAKSIKEAAGGIEIL